MADKVPESATGRSSIWGVGPRIGTFTAICFATTLLIDRLTAPTFHFAPPPSQVTTFFGLALIVSGLSLYLLTLRSLLTARRDGQLMTTGPYRLVRHPLYAIGLFFLCPGVSLLFESWIVLTTPLTMALIVRHFIRREEADLIADFGEPYRSYQARTPALIPLLGRACGL